MRPQVVAPLAFAVATFALSLPAPLHAARPERAQGVVPYVIVTDTTLVAAFGPLAAAHTSAGLAAAIRTVQSIRADYPTGRDDAESIRMFLRDAHADWQIRFVLLGGDDPLVPIRRVFLRLSQIISFPDLLMPTDQYYACLAGNWDVDGDGLWGELPYPNLGEPGDDVSFIPDLAVGRAPVTTPGEAQVFVQKTLDAMAATAAGGPISVLLTGAANGNTFPPLIDFASLSEQLQPLFTADPANHVTRLYQFPGSWPGSELATRASVLDSLERGYDVLVLNGPGGPGVFAPGTQPQENIVSADLAALTNARPMHAVALSAYTNQPGTFSIGAALLRDPSGGAASVLGPVDIEFTVPSYQLIQGVLARIYGPDVPPQDVPSIGEALAATIASFGAQGDVGRLTTQGNLLLGDPALLMPGTAAGGVTPVTMSLVSAVAEPGVVRLAWFAGGATGLAVDVERSTPASAWARVATVTQDGEGRLVYEDRDVLAGGRYGYRLAYTEDGARRTGGEAWVTVPAAPVLALSGPRPNPAVRALAVAFSLPDAAPARLEVLDVAGRVVRAREVGTLGAGSHVVDLTEGRMPPPGVYLVRLTRAGTSLTQRASVIR